MLDGTLHFIQFETRRMEAALEMIKALRLERGIALMYATGGGAHKFAPAFKAQLGIELQSRDELATMVRALLFVVSQVPAPLHWLLRHRLLVFSLPQRVEF